MFNRFHWPAAAEKTERDEFTKGGVGAGGVASVARAVQDGHASAACKGGGGGAAGTCPTSTVPFTRSNGRENASLDHLAPAVPHLVCRA